jgi:hypothetical protein
MMITSSGLWLKLSGIKETEDKRTSGNE